MTRSPTASAMLDSWRADVAVADDAEGAPAELVAAAGRLVPDALVHARGLLRQPADQRDDLAEHQLDDAARVRERRVEDRHPRARPRRPGRPGSCRCRSTRRPGGPCRPRATSGVIVVLDRMPSRETPGSASTSSGPLIAAERTSTSIPPDAEGVGGHRMDVLEEQGFHTREPRRGRRAVATGPGTGPPSRVTRVPVELATIHGVPLSEVTVDGPGPDDRQALPRRPGRPIGVLDAAHAPPRSSRAPGWSPTPPPP